MKMPAASKCSCSYQGLIFITWNAMNKSRMWSQNSLRQPCNVFVYTFIKHQFKRITYWMFSRKSDKTLTVVLIKSNLKQVKKEPVEVCIAWKVVGFFEFYIFPGYKNINRLCGAMAQWLRCQIPNPGVPCTKPLSGSKVDLVFHPSEVDEMSTRNFWKRNGEK